VNDFKDLQYFVNSKIKTNQLIYDCDDTSQVLNIKNETVSGTLNSVNLIIFKSQYQKSVFDKYNLPEEKILIIPDGINLSDYKKKEIVKNPNRICITENYGVETILFIKYVWPKIYEKNDKSELYICCEIEQKELIQQPGIYNLKNKEDIIECKYSCLLDICLSNSAEIYGMSKMFENLVTRCILVISNKYLFKEIPGLQYNLDLQNLSIYQELAEDLLNKMSDLNFINSALDSLSKIPVISWDIATKCLLDKIIR
jgi:hypothetical protein